MGDNFDRKFKELSQIQNEPSSVPTLKIDETIVTSEQKKRMETGIERGDQLTKKCTKATERLREKGGRTEDDTMVSISTIK